MDGLKPRTRPPRIVEHTSVKRIRAAGGVLCRPGPSGLLEIALIHRPAYDDWSLPKGKIDAGETPEEAALREVEEETGYACRLQRPLGCTAYVDRRGRNKVVCYWIMRWQGGDFRPNYEVDQLRWLTLDEALPLLTYDRDRALLEALPAA